jgi:hypothetical protein
VDRRTGLARTLRKAGADLADMKAANERVGAIVAGEARRLAPVATGRLQRSIKPTRTASKVQVRAGRLGAYPYVQEYGSPAKHIRARAFMRGALAERGDDAAEQYLREMDRIVGTVRGE